MEKYTRIIKTMNRTNFEWVAQLSRFQEFLIPKAQQTSKVQHQELRMGILGLTLLALLMLVGCASSPSAVQSGQPAPVAVGLLEVSISGIVSGSPKVKANWTGSAGGVSRQEVELSVQQPEFVPRLAQVLETNNASGSVIRYVMATLEIRNTTETTFNQMLLYPLNQPAITLAGTGLRQILAPDGSPITNPVLAQGILPSQGMLASGLNATVNPTQAQLQWLTSGEVAEVKAALPSLGLSSDAEPLQYAFFARNTAGATPGARRSIAAGQTGYVSLAFAFPSPQIRNQTPDTVVLNFVVGNDPTSALSQSIEEQSQGTAAGLNTGNPELEATAEVRVLSGSTYGGGNRRQLCRIVTAGSLAAPLAVMGSLPVNQSTCAVVPVKPNRLANSNLSFYSTTIGWNTVLEAEGYSLERGLGASPTAWTVLYSGAAITFSDQSLQPATLYTYRVRSSNPTGSSDWSTLEVTTPALPFFQETVAEGLGDIPWSLNFAPNGNLLFTLRNQATLQLGRLDLSSNQITAIRSDPPIAVRVGAEGTYNEGGAMGMELDPDFASNNRVYICYSYWLDNVQTPSNRLLRVSRLEIVENTLTNQQVLLDRIEGTDIHSGCRVVQHSGYLYISTGDAQSTQGSQRLDVLTGKILRIALDGSIPTDNPDWDNDPATNSPIWTMGHRNPQGLAVQPSSGLLWSTEHGPYTRDEINIIRPGRNYGWPLCIGTQAFATSVTAREWNSTQTFDCNTTANLTQTNYQPALREYDSERGIAISDLVFYPQTATAFPQWRNHILFVALRTGRLYRLEVSGETLGRDEILIKPELLPDPLIANATNRLRDIAVGPDGFLYISSDNGKIVRLRPRGAN